MSKQKAMRILKDTRVIIFLVSLFLGLLMLHPQPFTGGVAIRSVARNSSALLAGIESPPPNAQPISRERIVAMNNVPISSLEDYYGALGTLGPNRTVLIKTSSKVYRVELGDLTKAVTLNETVLRTVIVQETSEELVDGVLTNVTRNVTSTEEVAKTALVPITAEEALGLRVEEAASSNIRLGLDLQGGTRVLLQPEQKLSTDEMGVLLDNMKERLNVYGLSDVVVRTAGDLSGNTYILIEIAGVNEEEVKHLLARQGKFEARVGNSTVFRGGNDITYVCRTADCSGIDPNTGCGQSSSGWGCRFYFQITLSQEAAERQADATKNLEVLIDESGEGYLSEKLDLILDDQVVSSLSIASSLRGQAATQISITGGGNGRTQEEAIQNSLTELKRLQTILITGSLPVKLNIVKTDSISPSLGRAFLRSALIMGVFSILAVAAIILLRYRKPILVIPILLVNWAEIYLLLAVASLIGWNLDVASIAGIIIMIGTGVNDQIVITDETLHGGPGSAERSTWKERLKKAFFIVFAAYFTTVGSMVPLLFAGAGLLKGFAVTTIIGITIGVLITRPAYANAIEIILEE